VPVVLPRIYSRLVRFIFEKCRPYNRKYNRPLVFMNSRVSVPWGNLFLSLHDIFISLFSIFIKNTQRNGTAGRKQQYRCDFKNRLVVRLNYDRNCFSTFFFFLYTYISLLFCSCCCCCCSCFIFVMY
jgi:hypothetical protein